MGLGDFTGSAVVGIAAGISAAMVNTSNLTGNHIKIKIGGVVVGLAQNVTIATQSDIQKLHGIGSLEACDMAPGTVVHNISGEIMILSNQALDQAKTTKTSTLPNYNKTKRSLLPVNGDQWIQDGTFDVEVIDKLRYQILAYFVGCLFSRYTLKINKHISVISEFSIEARERQK